MRAAITAVLPDPAPAITWTGPIGAAIAAHCSAVGSRPLSALRMLGVAMEVVAAPLALTARLPRTEGRPTARRRTPAARRRSRAAALAREGPRPVATSDRWS